MTTSKVQDKHLLLMVATATIAMKFVRSLQWEDKKKQICRDPHIENSKGGLRTSGKSLLVPCGEKERKETKLKKIRNQIEIKKEIS